MSTTLPPGAKLPITFSPGDALTADSLNQIQLELLTRLLTHTHSGNSQTDQEGVVLEANALADASIEERLLANGAITTAALADKSVTKAKLEAPLQHLLYSLEKQSRKMKEHFYELELELEETAEQLARDKRGLRHVFELVNILRNKLERLQHKEHAEHHHLERAEVSIILHEEHLQMIDQILELQGDRINQIAEQDKQYEHHTNASITSLSRHLDLLRERFESFQESTEQQIQGVGLAFESIEKSSAAMNHMLMKRLERLEAKPAASTWGYFRIHNRICSYDEQNVHNVRKVSIIESNDYEIIEVQFIHPYIEQNYTALFSPETKGLHGLPIVTPTIIHRDSDFIRFGFWDGSRWFTSDLAWNLIIFGELEYASNY